MSKRERRSSLQFSPVSPIVTTSSHAAPSTRSINAVMQDNNDLEADKAAMSNSGCQASRHRVDWSRSQAIYGSTRKSSIRLTVEVVETVAHQPLQPQQEEPFDFICVLRRVYPTISNKPLSSSACSHVSPPAP
ncbi:hypothetical protein M422DRAFT_258533 [Sphaerobolus stellatus SS14]|uniref:Uncharacterized protein n=1 Tax=Sphaerobolus stellatus (strain SS14) TaxID=990650 RepID=A0A0C9U6L2_SPHS4|nr:hypothetical protein M422DRAFT_258533 [Sphaerobolus stellatus SS14]